MYHFKACDLEILNIKFLSRKYGHLKKFRLKKITISELSDWGGLNIDKTGMGNRPLKFQITCF